MPLFVLSGLPSPEKKNLFLRMASSLVARYKIENSEGNSSTLASILVVLQNAVGVNAREETARLRSLIQNNLSKQTLLMIYAPLHIKGLRYEISSSAKNMEIDTAHIHCSIAYKEGGQILGKEIENLSEIKCEVIEVLPGKGGIEDFSVISRIFEVPRKTDKWDVPCFTADEYNIEHCEEPALNKVWAVLHNAVKARTSSKKLISGPLNTRYLQTTKEAINEVLEEKRKVKEIPLRIARQSEIDFLNSIKMAPPAVDKIKEIYGFFLDKYLN